MKTLFFPFASGARTESTSCRAEWMTHDGATVRAPRCRANSTDLPSAKLVLLTVLRCCLDRPSTLSAAETCHEKYIPRTTVIDK